MLPSGTALTVRADEEGEEIQLRSPDGGIELRIRMTDDGPVLMLRGVKLAIEASDSVSVNCRDFTVNASAGIQLATPGAVAVSSGADLRLKSAGPTFIDGEIVNLNCLDRTGYPDHVPQDAPALEAGEGG